MKVAVTGITGHLGGAVVRELHSGNYAIRALIRIQPKLWFENIPIEFINGDLHDHRALATLMDGCDYLIHLAGHISLNGAQGGKVFKTNVEGVKNVMETAKQTGIRRVIHISSIHAYQQHPIHERLDERRVKADRHSFVYDHTKREGEEIAHSYNSESMDVLVVNPTSIIGPYDFKPSRTGKTILDLYKGKLPFLFKGGFDFCDSRDVASAIVNALNMGRKGESYVLGGTWHSLNELSKFVSIHSIKKHNVIILPVLFGWLGLPIVFALGRLKKSEPLYTNEALVAITDGNRKISSAKAITELNYHPRPVHETITDTCRWFLENGYLD